MQHEDFGLELVPLVQDVPQLLQGEAGPVRVLWVEASRLLLAQSLLPRDESVTKRKQSQREKRKKGRKDRWEEGEKEVRIPW